MSQREVTSQEEVSLLEHLQDIAHEAARHSDNVDLDLSGEVARRIRYPNISRDEVFEILKDFGFDVLCGLQGTMLSHELYLDQLLEIIRELEEMLHPCSPGRIIDTCTPSRTQTSIELSIFSSSICNYESISYDFRYLGDVVVDRHFHHNSCASELGFQRASSCCHAQASQQVAARSLIDCLRHRVNPLTHLMSHASKASTIEDWGSTFEDDEGADAMVDLQEANFIRNQVTPFELLIQIMEGSDLVAQIAISKLLLSQRGATPLVLPVTQGAVSFEKGVVTLKNYIQGLCFVEVALANEQKMCIADDMVLPRVVFLSNKSVVDSHAAIIGSRVLHCDFMSQHCRREMGKLITPVVEVGVGFVTAMTQEPLTCLCFLVTGPYHQVIDFVEAIADVVVLELEQGQQADKLPHFTSAKVLRWQESDMKEQSSKKSMMIWGQESYVVGEIANFLSVVLSHRKVGKPKKSLMQVCTSYYPPHQLINFQELQWWVEQCDLKSIDESLRLQKSFIVEAQAHFEFLQLKDSPHEKRVRENRCQEQRNMRINLGKAVMKHPILEVFHILLSKKDAMSRRVGMMWLESVLSKISYTILEEESRTNLNEQKFNIKAKEEQVGLENLWRETCHIFEADPMHRRYLAREAAQHLLDGFPLEILDGDAGMFCNDWIQSVLMELDTMTKIKLEGKSARIFVLSAMGLQSSGKSTMLNLMFGTQLRTSVGRCTQGIYMQLVPSERAEFDYVILLDTEGLRSPEYFVIESSEARDNRLATFGLLPADASIFMVLNEDDSGLKEVLPMVMLAFKGSTMAEICGGRIKAKMVFIYRSIDTNAKKNLKSNKDKLQKYLREAAEQVVNIGGSSTKQGNKAGEDVHDVGFLPLQEDQVACGLLQSVFTEFRVDDEEVKSDVKCMGSLKKGCMPPGDTPDWAYGEQVIELREYIHERVMEGGWKAIGLKEWAEHLTLVWECVCSADFELSFRNAIEYSSYRDLHAKLRFLRTEICQKYMDEFENLEQKVRTMEEDDLGTSTLFGILEANLENAVTSKSKEVQQMLGKKNWTKWRIQELNNWQQFCASTKEWYKKRIDDMESGVIKFEKVLANYEVQIKEKIINMMDMDTQSILKESTEIRRQKFNEFFESISQQAAELYPPIADQIPMNVADRYKQAGLAKRFDLYTTPSIFVETTTDTEEDHLAQNGGKRKCKQEERHTLLHAIIERQLRDARQYSEVIIDNVIMQTTSILETRRQTNEDQRDAHIWVMRNVIERMQAVQRQWDEDHNVVEKLRLKAKPRLYQFFNAQADGLEATNMLIAEMQSLLEDELEETHNHLVVKKVATQLGQADWVMDWKVMRDFVDLHLLTLTNRKTKKNTEKLLRFISNGSLHFRQLTSALIKQAITTEMLEQEWEGILQNLEICLVEKSAATNNRSINSLLGDLADNIGKCVDSRLGNYVASHIHKEFYKDYMLDANLYHQKVLGLCQSIREKMLPNFNMMREFLPEQVRERMIEREEESCRPRCEESCPLCGITCFYAMGHTTKHDAIHQSSGLSGRHLVHSHELVAQTCLDSLNEDNVFEHKSKGRYVSYKEFDRVYQTWANPSKNEKISIAVREFIFFHYQYALARFYSSKGDVVKPCPSSSMPTNYNHDINRLRAALYNRLRPTFQDSNAWKSFLELLPSI